MPSSPPLTASQRLLEECSDELAALERDGLLRRPVSIDAVDGSVVRIGGRDLVNWCSNDYLGLAAHPALVQAAAQAADTWGIGARASRLLAGTTRWHDELEARFAAWFGAETSVLFPSGYQANLGALAALCSSQDLIVVDRLAHASLLDAAG